MSTGDLCIHSDTTDGSVIFIDSSANNYTLTPSGNVRHSTAQKKFGNSSIYFDNYEDRILIPAFGNLPNESVFTIDMWCYFINNAATDEILGNCTSSSGSFYSGYSLRREADRKLKFSFGTLGLYYQSTSIVPDTTWTHIAVVKGFSGNIRIAINGVFRTTTGGSTGFTSNGINTYLGGLLSSANGMYGYIDEPRITLAEVWTEDFTPPTEPYTDIISYDFLFIEGTGVITPGNEAHFNFLPGEDYHIGTIVADLPTLTVSLSGNSFLPPYNILNADIPILSVEMAGDSWAGAIGDTYGDIAANLPILDCVMYSGGAEINCDLPILCVEMSTPIEPIIGQIDCLLPILDIEMVQIDPITASLEISLPLLVSTSTGQNNFTKLEVLLPLLSISLFTGARLAIDLPLLQSEIQSSTALSGSIIATLPMLECELFTGARMSITLPSLSPLLVGETPLIAHLTASLMALSVNMSGTSNDLTRLVVDLPILQVEAESKGSLYNKIDIELPGLTSALTGVNGGVGNIDCDLPVLTSIMQGFFHREGGNYINVSLPVLYASLTGDPAIEISTILRHIRGQER